jgi:membrane protease YdiL (CAAX protease family)
LKKDIAYDFQIKHSIVAYSVLAYGITGVIVLPLLLAETGIINTGIPYFLHYLAPYGPLISAVLVSYRERREGGMQNLLQSLGKWRIRSRMILISVLSPWIFFLIAGLIVMRMEGTFPNIDAFGTIPYGDSSCYLTFAGAWMLWILTFGLGEETGWRAFLLPRVQRKFGALTSSLIVAGLWCLWHVPFFFYNPNFQAFGFFGSIMWAIGLMFGSVFLTWIYNSSEGSTLMTIIWHGTFNLFTAAYGQVTENTAGIISMLVILVAVISVVIYGRKDLSDFDRQIV